MSSEASPNVEEPFAGIPPLSARLGDKLTPIDIINIIKQRTKVRLILYTFPIKILLWCHFVLTSVSAN